MFISYNAGRAILCCKWAEVVDLILRPRSDDPKDLIRAREYWAATKDPKGTLNKIPRQKCMESKLLQGLIKYCSGSKNDFLGALQVLPRNMRLMYVHAYQSYVWNSMVTRRIKVSEIEMIRKLTFWRFSFQIPRVHHTGLLRIFKSHN